MTSVGSKTFTGLVPRALFEETTLYRGRPLKELSRDELIDALVVALRDKEQWRLRAIDYLENPLLRT